jgi:peptidoglycan/xylan/chitin deacetylase (PgdA/CDA1 family)
MKLPAHNRYDYIPIHKRAQYEWPNGARLAVTFCNNIEYFAFGAGLGSDSTGAAAAQSQRNYAWRDYGNRVGIWYYLDLLDEFGLPGAHNVNSAVIEQCPDIVERLNGRGDEYVGHGRTNSERQDLLWEEDEARLIAECTEVLTRLTGRRPEGWLGPYIAQSGVTLDLLKEAGYRYVMDWAMDDQPIWMRTRSGSILSVPYPLEINDSPALVFRRHWRQFVGWSSTSSTRRWSNRADTRWYSRSRYILHHYQLFRSYVPRRRPPHRANRDACDHHQEIARYCEGLPKGTIRGSD